MLKMSDIGLWSLELVSVEKAVAYLGNRGPNRKVKNCRVAEYARAMSCKDWKITHQGIAFNKDGQLIDGQHRLEAVVKSGIPQWFMVFRWKTDTTMECLDDGKSRTVCDAGEIAGLSYTTSHPAVVRIIENVTGTNTGGSNGRITRIEMMRKIEAYREAIDWSVERLGHDRGTGSAVIAAAVTMAWYTADRERLYEFCEILRSGVCSKNEDNSAIRVRDWLMTPHAIGGNCAARMASFRKIQSGLRAFLDRRPLAKLYESSGLLFPIPQVDECQS